MQPFDAHLLNIAGNRHILLDGIPLPSWKSEDGRRGLVVPEYAPTGETASFRELTRCLLKHFEAVQSRLSLALLPGMLERPDMRIARITLIGSDQTDVESPGTIRTDQDTLYAVRIVARLLAERMGIPVDIEVQTISVVDPNAQLRYFFGLLRKLKESLGDQRLVLLDSGGTAQQKTGMRLAAEFLMPSHQLAVYRSERSGESASVVRPQPSVVYRSIIQREQLRSLVQLDHYDAALDVLPEVDASFPRRAVVKALLMHGYFRRRRQWETAREHLKAASAAGFESPWSRDFLAYEPSEEELPMATFCATDTRLELRERWSLACRLWDLERWSDWVHELGSFVEHFALVLVVQAMDEKSLMQAERGAFIAALKRYLLQEGIPESKLKKDVEAKLIGRALTWKMEAVSSRQALAIQCILAAQKGYDYRNQKEGQTRVSDLRNRVAHGGAPVEAHEVQRIHRLEDIRKGFSELMGANRPNPYEQINQTILDAL